MKGLYTYFTSGRKALAYLNTMQKSKDIKESYSIPEKDGKTPEYVCQYCGFKHSRKTVICKNCGENLL
jgi:DNA-directed RNA polymerase subunit RPC12/RpoP